MLQAMAAMVLLVFIVAVLTIKARVQGVKAGEVRAKYFRLMQGDELPESVAKTTRSFNNQFEVPVLFYAAGILHIVLLPGNQLGLYLAWGFVLLRYLHAFIHITYNHVMHRLAAFFGALVCVAAMWLNLLVAAA